MMLHFSLVAGFVAGVAPAASAQEPARIANARTVVRAALAEGACTGFDVAALEAGRETPVAEVRFVPGSLAPDSVPVQPASRLSPPTSTQSFD